MSQNCAIWCTTSQQTTTHTFQSDTIPLFSLAPTRVSPEFVSRSAENTAQFNVAWLRFGWTLQMLAIMLGHS